MFDELSVDPSYTFNGDGAEVFTAFSGESVAVYIDGERIYSYDSLPTGRLMGLIADHTDGNLKAYGSAEAVRDARTGETLYNEDLPKDPTDIIFSDDIEVVVVRDAEDLRENLQSTQGEHVIVQIRAGIVDEDMVREYASDDFAEKLIEIQDRA